MSFEPIGQVRSPRLEPVDDDWDGVTATITLDAGRFSPDALSGLDQFSHVEVVYLFDRVDPDGVETAARHPRGNEDWPVVGIFAQRARSRPNRIGVCVCRLLATQGLTVTVQALDAIDGTPVLDLKPYMSEFGPRGEQHQPAWSRELMAGYWAPQESLPRPAFATDPATADYYERRAGEYDEWYRNEGSFAARSRPGWEAEVDQVVALVAALPPARTIDVACGTGFLTRHLRGFVVGLDQSPAMVAICQSRLPHGLAVVGDALHLVVADGAFDRVMAGHFYGHLPPDERAAFTAEAHRVAGELIVIDTARRPDTDAEQWQERVLNDGSRHRVFKRYLSGDQLAAEIGGRSLMGGQWFVAARATWEPA